MKCRRSCLGHKPCPRGPVSHCHLHIGANVLISCDVVLQELKRNQHPATPEDSPLTSVIIGTLGILLRSTEIKIIWGPID